MTTERSPEERLHTLTREDAKNWITIGRLLIDLEDQSRAAPSGRPWQDVIRDRLAQVDAPISPGQVYKLRRAIGFLSEHAPDAMDPQNSFPPKISAIEVAERLYRLDPEAGKKALEDVLAPEPATYVDLQKRYAEALKANPEMKSPRQIAWESRRKTDKPLASESIEKTSPSSERPEDAAGSSAEALTSGPSKSLRKKHDDLLSQSWDEGWDAAKEAYSAVIAALNDTITAQTKEIATNADEIEYLQAELEILGKMIRELRGD